LNSFLQACAIAAAFLTGLGVGLALRMAQARYWRRMFFIARDELLWWIKMSEKGLHQVERGTRR